MAIKFYQATVEVAVDVPDDADQEAVLDAVQGACAETFFLDCSEFSNEFEHEHTELVDRMELQGASIDWDTLKVVKHA